MGLFSIFQKNHDADAPSNNSPLFDGGSTPGAERRRKGRRKNDAITDTKASLMSDDDDYEGRPDPNLPLKRRARRRLIGAVCMVVIAAIILPLVLDKEPPSKDTPVVIQLSKTPSKTADNRGQDKSLPLSAAAMDDPPADKGEEVTGANKSVAIPNSAKEPKKNDANPNPHGATANAVKNSAAKPAMDPSAEKNNADAGKAEAKRLVLQIGAYATAAKAQEVRNKVEAVGVKTFIQVVKTKEGDRTRVRAGPFASKEEAETAQSKLKAAGIAAAVIDL